MTVHVTELLVGKVEPLGSASANLLAIGSSDLHVHELCNDSSARVSLRDLTRYHFAIAFCFVGMRMLSVHFSRVLQPNEKRASSTRGRRLGQASRPPSLLLLLLWCFT